MDAMTSSRLRSNPLALGAALTGLSLLLSACSISTGENPNPGGAALYRRPLLKRPR